MFNKLHFIVLMEVLLFRQIHASLEDKEPGINKFTFDEQLLKKVIRMELKMEQMDRAMKQVEDRVTNALQNVTLEIENKTAELVMLEEKINTPLVAFSAYGLADRSLDTNQIMVLQHIYLNEGKGYDDVVGVFTTPVAGVYLFSVHICQSSAKPFHYYLVKEHSAIAKSTKYNSAANDCASMTTLTKSTVGQRVWVKCASGSGTQLYDSTYYQTTFSGVLLHL